MGEVYGCPTRDEDVGQVLRKQKGSPVPPSPWTVTWDWPSKTLSHRCVPVWVLVSRPPVLRRVGKRWTVYPGRSRSWEARRAEGQEDQEKSRRKIFGS